MSCGLTQGRNEPPCFDNIGGIKNVYLFPFVEYAFGSIVGVKDALITAFPGTTLYKYETNNANFSETINNDDKGVSYSQSLTFTLLKQDLLTTNELNKLTQLDLRYVVEYNNGLLKMGGANNGVSLDSYTIDSGTTKASLNGYNLTFTSEEIYIAPFVKDLSIFGESFLLLEDNFNILLEDSGLIIVQ